MKHPDTTSTKSQGGTWRNRWMSSLRMRTRCTGGSSEDLCRPQTTHLERKPRPIPKVYNTFTLLAGTTHFSKLAASGGLPWQKNLAVSIILKIPLQQASIWNIICPGTNSTKRMNKIQEGLEAVVCLRDGMLIRLEQRRNDRCIAAVLEVHRTKPSASFVSPASSKNWPRWPYVYCITPEQTQK